MRLTDEQIKKVFWGDINSGTPWPCAKERADEQPDETADADRERNDLKEQA